MPEIWDLLDENGNKIGKTIQRGEPIPEGLYHLGADVWIVNSQNQILIQKRSPREKTFSQCMGYDRWFCDKG